VSAQLFSDAGTDRRRSAGEARTALNGLQRMAVASQAIRQRGVGDQGRLAPRELFGHEGLLDFPARGCIENFVPKVSAC
jgi:hypothetical protein